MNIILSNVSNAFVTKINCCHSAPWLFLFKWSWLWDIIPSLNALSPLRNMCFIIQALGSTQHKQSFNAAALIVSSNQRRSSETIKCKKKRVFALIPARLRWTVPEHCSAGCAFMRVGSVPQSQLQFLSVNLYNNVSCSRIWEVKHHGGIPEDLKKLLDNLARTAEVMS